MLFVGAGIDDTKNAGVGSVRGNGFLDDKSAGIGVITSSMTGVDCFVNDTTRSSEN